LNLRVPWWLSPFLGSDSIVLTKSLEWSVNYCVLEHMFNETSSTNNSRRNDFPTPSLWTEEPSQHVEPPFTISTEFLRDRQALEWRFVLIGAIQFLFLPFVIIFMIIHFFLQNAQQFHSTKEYLGPRQWSPLALWTFREFNELPHIFEERIQLSIKPTNLYIAAFRNPHVTQIAKSVAYISGSVVAVLVIISFINESVMIHVQVLEHNLFWYLGLFSAVFAAARSLIPDYNNALAHNNSIVQRDGAGAVGAGLLLNNGNFVNNEIEELVRRIGAHTHYTAPSWVGRCHTPHVQNAISDMFPYRVHIFAMEIYSALLTPIALCFVLPKCAGNILEFVRCHSRYVEGIGSVLDYSTFECFAEYGDSDFGVPVNSTKNQQK
jgi:autophagy-related protein 9